MTDHVRSRLLTVFVFTTMFVLMVFTIVVTPESDPVVVGALGAALFAGL